MRTLCHRTVAAPRCRKGPPPAAKPPLGVYIPVSEVVFQKTLLSVEVVVAEVVVVKVGAWTPLLRKNHPKRGGPTRALWELDPR